MDWSSLGEMPTRLDLEETEVISIDSESYSDYVPPEPVYKPGSLRPEPAEEAPEDPRPGPSREREPSGEDPGVPNIFTDSASGTEREPSREDPGAPNIFTDSVRGREEEGPWASNDFNDSARPRVRGRVRGIPGSPVQCVAPFFRGSGNRRNFLGSMRPM